MNEKFSLNEKELIDNNLDLELKPEYKKMLNNLLGIANRDNSIFASSRNKNIDLFNIVKNENIKKIFKNKTFQVEIESTKNIDFISLLDKQSNPIDFIKIIDEEGFFLSMSSRKILNDNFQDEKLKIINKIKISQDKQVAKWKRIKNNYLDLKMQTNSWPIFIGTMFIKVRTAQTTLYAPLLLKKIEINISNNNKIIIKTIDESVDLNEKLLFLLQNEYKFNLPKMDREKGFSFDEVIEVYKESLSKIIRNEVNFQDKFVYQSKTSIKNPILEYAPGTVITLSSPMGSNLRNRLIKLLKNKESIENILDFDIFTNVNEIVNKKLEKGEGIYRITPTDLSQEKAIFGSLEDNAIIWGPPGTGKSQTICNIIANLLFDEKKVIVTSQKKAALDVIQERMGKLSKFMFFGLTDKNMSKKKFYEPFNDIAKIVNMQINNIEKEKRSYFTSYETNYYNQKNILKYENISSLLKARKQINKFPKFIKNLQNNHIFLKKNRFLIEKLENKKDIKDFLDSKHCQKKGLFFKRYPKNIRKIIKLYKNTNKDIDFLFNFSRIENFNNFNNFDKLIDNENQFASNKRIFDSDENFLDNILKYKLIEKIKTLYSEENEEWKKKIISFIKNCKSSFRLPHKFIHIHKEVISKIFNIFISTPQTLATIIDWNIQYDHAIFDEASQLHLEKAIPFMSISKHSVIAGDSQQMRPTNFFGIRDNTKIRDESEENANSLLDFAYKKGLQNTREYMLNKNYRAKSSQLMSFSSKQFYNGKLDVVDDFKYSNPNPIEVISIDGKWENRINEKEAYLVLDKCLEELSNYKKIIILALNSNQKQFIENLIYNDSKYIEIIEKIGNENIYLRNLENIQGDEADLVIISVAYDKNAKLSSTYVARPEGQHALNVAISRAKEKMIVIKSIASNEVVFKNNNKSIFIFKEWLSFIELPKIKKTTYSIEKNLDFQKFDSNFEEKVYEFLENNLVLDKKCYIETQYEVGSYKIDLAILNSENRKFLYGIEVDGYRYHSGFKKTLEDIERQSFIEAKGYPIYRITELNWKINKKSILRDIQNLLM